MIDQQNLFSEIQLHNVFFEEPLDNQGSDKIVIQTDFKVNRKELERRRFIETKVLGNQQEQLFLIDAKWVKKWINYVRYSSAPSPGMIINDQLYLLAENQHSMTLGEDLFTVSSGIWNLFYEWYGGGPTLKWRIKQESGNLQPAKISSRPQQLQPEQIVDYKVDTSHTSIKEDDYNYDFNRLKAKKYGQKQKIIHKPQKEPFQMETRKPPRDSLNDNLRSFRGNQKCIFGLENSNLFCYVNAVLQSLFTIDDFRDFYAKEKFLLIKVKKPLLQSLQFSECLADFAQNITKAQQSQTCKVIRTFKLRKLIRQDFSPRFEHDSHEFLLYLLNKLKDELTERDSSLPSSTQTDSLDVLWNYYSSFYPSLVDKLFTVIEKTQIKCNLCDKYNESLQYYLTFPLQVEGNATINESLKQYCSLEQISDYTCEYCKSKLKLCKLRRQIMKLPQIFIFQLQRFSMYPYMRKIRNVLRYSEYIDMHDYILKEYKKEVLNQPTLFELVSVAVHMGNINGGHYIAYAKKEDGYWYSFDDERVGRVSKEEVLQQDAYLLFYKRVDE